MTDIQRSVDYEKAGTAGWLWYTILILYNGNLKFLTLHGKTLLEKQYRNLINELLVDASIIITK